MTPSDRISGPGAAGYNPAPDLNGSQLATVQVGESNLPQVAQRLGVDLGSLAAANPQISDPTKLRVGQDIRLPQSQNPQVPVSNSETASSSGASASNFSPAPIGDPLTKSLTQADLAAKAQDPKTTKSTAGDCFLKLDGVEGESLDEAHKF